MQQAYTIKLGQQWFMHDINMCDINFKQLDTNKISKLLRECLASGDHE
jgi:hypothetical protein